jgi:predicted HicB family RNase H-like nuclease
MKTLKISDELHTIIKLFCEREGLKLNNWVEKQLKEKIKELNV